MWAALFSCGILEIANADADVFEFLVEKPGQTLSLKERVLQSAKIAVKAMGYSEHSIFAEQL